MVREFSTSSVVFDGDDTLWETQELYEVAKRRFFEAVRHLGFSESEVAQRFADVDVANVAILGFSPIRFPRSMRETYEHFARALGQSPELEVSRSVEGIGRLVFEATPALRDDSVRVLAGLKPTCRLILFTAGDPGIQELRVKQSGLLNYFHDIRITTSKNADSWRSLVVELAIQPAKSWSVGNSVRSDINPALGLGFRGIVVAGSSWEYERAAVCVPTGSAPPRNVSSLTEAAEIIQSEVREFAKATR